MRGTSRGGWLALLIVLVLMTAPGARGQTSQVDNSGVDTKTPPPVKDDAVPVEPGLKLRPGERLRMDVNLVMVPVTVTDGLNRLVTGLERENFFIFSDGVLQDIKTFSVEDAPVSIGIVLDLSGSMTNKVDKAKQAILQLLKTSNPQDEYFVITFNDRPELVQDFTSSEADVRTHLVSLQPGHRTALLDAMYYGIVKMKGAKYSRRALIVVSDGGDNRSRYTNGEVASLLKEADTEIFAMGIFDMYAPSPEEVHGPELLSEYCEGTGGRLFKVDDIDDLPDIATKISASLRNQYVLGFAPKDQKRDGKWRKLKVRLVPPNGLPALEVHARNGYYAPAD
jgi:Ca-activated chloride channel family protein